MINHLALNFNPSSTFLASGDDIVGSPIHHRLHLDDASSSSSSNFVDDDHAFLHVDYRAFHRGIDADDAALAFDASDSKPTAQRDRQSIVDRKSRRRRRR